MAKAKRKPWYATCRWTVQTIAKEGTKGAGQWVDIYCTGSKRTASMDAKAWEVRTGQKTRIVHGPGHKTQRGF